MRNTFKKMLTALLTLSMTVSMFAVPTFAAQAGIEAGSKTAKLDKGSKNSYTVEVKVPGGDPKELHDEVILMVDGSDSMGNAWSSVQAAINSIGQTVLNGAGNTQLTLMAFGMGENEVLVHVKSAEELASSLNTLTDLLYGRSATNCEAGFNGVINYIEDHDESLNEVQVIYVSDGNVNTDESIRVFDTKWKEYADLYAGALLTAQATFKTSFYYETSDGSYARTEKLPAAFRSVFGNRFKGATYDEILERTFNGGEVTEEEFLEYCDKIWADVFKYSKLKSGEEYPVSVVERAFVKYDKAHKTHVQELFYYTIFHSIKPAGKEAWYGNREARSIEAAETLAAMPQVESLYIVDYSGYSAWMDTGITNEKSVYLQSNGISNLLSALSGTLTDLSTTPYNDVVVTDYMSKWVNLDTASIEIVDKAADEVIWNATEGWLVDEADRPTAVENPVVIELVDPADYAQGGEDVEGNENGDIYKLTWTVKDGALLRSDNYALRYNVTVDSAETGFRYNKNYPANGVTRADYIDENNDEASYDIKVPNVKIKKVEPKAYSLTVNYLDKESGESISASYTTSMEEGSSYDVTDKNAIAIDGYTWDSTDAALTGTLTGDVVINVYYTADEEIVEIPEEETPKAEEPEIDEPVIEEPTVEEIPEEDVPLADVPKTGDASLIWILAAVISAAGMFFLNTTDKRRNEI